MNLRTAEDESARPRDSTTFATRPAGKNSSLEWVVPLLLEEVSTAMKTEAGRRHVHFCTLRFAEAFLGEKYSGPFSAVHVFSVQNPAKPGGFL
jgi:hypothetical protein